MYRLAWFYFIDKKTGLNNAGTDKEIETLIKNTESQLHRLIHFTSGINGHSFILQHLTGAAKNLTEAANLLLGIYTRRNEAINIYICKNLILNLKSIEASIKSFKPLV
jgi:hypothetical protein